MFIGEVFASTASYRLISIQDREDSAKLNPRRFFSSFTPRDPKYLVRLFLQINYLFKETEAQDFFLRIFFKFFLYRAQISRLEGFRLLFRIREVIGIRGSPCRIQCGFKIPAVA
jgi:hypothetical protein